MNMLRLFASLLVCTSLCAVVYAQEVINASTAEPASSSSTLLQRVLQYEYILGTELSLDAAICLDSELSRSWFIPSIDIRPISSHSLDRIRRRLEMCSLSTSDAKDSTRLAGELKARLEAQLKSAQNLAEAKKKSTGCLNTSESLTTFRACLSTSVSDSVNEITWPKWMILYERRIAVAAAN